MRYYLQNNTRIKNGERNQLYKCYREDQYKLFEAHSGRLGKPIHVSFPSNLESPDIEIRFRKGYAFSGKIDILEIPSEQLLATFTRRKELLNTEGEQIGSFQDSRTWKQQLSESLVDAIGNLASGLASGNPESNAPNSFVFANGKYPLAYIWREKMPFHPNPQKANNLSPARKLAKKILPKKLGSLLADTKPPVAWTLQILEDQEQLEPRNLLMGALTLAELDRWA